MDYVFLIVSVMLIIFMFLILSTMQCYRQNGYHKRRRFANWYPIDAEHTQPELITPNNLPGLYADGTCLFLKSNNACYSCYEGGEVRPCPYTSGVGRI